jgi:hypothetical protein
VRQCEVSLSLLRVVADRVVGADVQILELLRVDEEDDVDEDVAVGPDVRTPPPETKLPPAR